MLVSDDGFVDHAAAGERLRAWVREDFGVELTSIDRVGHGADTAAEAWRGVSAAGASYAVKWSGGGTPAGLVVSAHLAEHGATGVVGPMPSRVGRLWSERGGRRLSVVPWVSDDRALNGGMTAQHWVSYGALLAQVHATAATEALTKLLPREQHTHEQVASAVRAFHNQLRSRVDESAGVEAPNDHLARALANEWRAAAGVLSTLLEHADDLGRELQTRQATNVVCHGDPHLGNMLLRDGGQVWLIDWDDAVLAPRERDLMFVIVGVLAFAPVSPQEQSWFFDGYGPTAVDPTRLTYYQCTRALEDLAGPAAEVLDVHRYTESDRADALSIFRGVLSPTGLASLALSSLRDLGRICDEASRSAQ